MLIRIVACLCVVGLVDSFPLQDLQEGYTSPRSRQAKQLIGQWIMNTEWLPVEINVPDTINTWSSGISSGLQNLAQQFPFINRIISQERPRPLQFFVMLPIVNTNQRIPQQNNEPYSPFDNFANKFPAYP